MLGVLQSLHERLAALEAGQLESKENLGTFWDIPLKLVESGAGAAARLDDQERYKVKYKLRMSTAASGPSHHNVLFPALSSEVDLHAWLFPAFCAQEHKEASEVVVTQEVYSTDRTNGLPGTLVVVKAQLRLQNKKVVPMVVKFRRIHVPRAEERQALKDTSTEREATNALRVQRRTAAKSLFAKPYFLCSFNQPHDASSYYRWEGFAMEPLVLLSREMGVSPAFYTMAFQLLSSLHAAGYVHGDPHRGNFMLRPTTSPPAAHLLVMIDWDHTWPLPVPFLPTSMQHLNPPGCFYDSKWVDTYVEESAEPDNHKNRLAAKAMMLHDFNRLLFVANPFVPLFDTGKIPDPAAQASIDLLLQQFMAEKFAENERNNTHEMICMPWYFSFDWPGQFQWQVDVVAQSLSHHANYRAFLDGITVHDLHASYKHYFSSQDPPKNMLNLNRQIQVEFAAWKAARNRPPSEFTKPERKREGSASASSHKKERR